MKKIIMLTVITLAFGVSELEAQYRTSDNYRVNGNYTIDSYGSSSITGTSQDLFGTTYHSFSNGTTGTSQDLFGTTHHSFSNDRRGY